MDKEYWNQFYKKNYNNKEIINPSSFALFCQNNFYNDSEKKIMELGCGNGRDSLYFARQGHTVYAIDQSNSMKYHSNQISKLDYVKVLASSFAYLILKQQDSVGMISFDQKIRKFITPKSKPSQLKLLTSSLENISF